MSLATMRLPILLGLAMLALTPSAASATGRPDFAWQRGGHGGIVYALAYSPRGDRFASASLDNGLGMQDRTIKLWQAGSGLLERTLSAGRGTSQLAFAPGSALLAAVHQNALGQDSAVDLWEVASGRLVRTIQAQGRWVVGVAFAPLSSLLALANNTGTIQLFNVDGSEVAVLRGSANAGLLAFSPDEQLLAAGVGGGANVILWQREPDGSYTERQTLIGPPGILEALAFSPRGDRVGGGAGTSVTLWRATDGSLERTIDDGELVTGMAFSPDGTLVGSSGYSRKVKLWSVDDGTLVQELNGPSVNWTPRVAFSPDGARIVHLVYPRELKIWEQQLDGSYAYRENATGHTDTAFAVAFSPIGDVLASGAALYGGFSRLGEVKLWRAASGELLQTLGGHSNGVYGVGFSPDGDLLASASWDRTIKLWRRAESGRYQLSQTLTGHTDQVNAAIFAGADVLATASKDTTIRIWRAGADGNFTLDQVLDRAAGGHVDEVEPLAFALGGALLVSGGHDQVVKVWSLGDDDRYALVETLEHAEEVEAAAVSRDGVLIAAGGEDGTLRVWERTGSGAYQVLASFTGHDGAAHSIAFLPDERRFISVGSGAVRFWSPDGTLLGDYDQEMGTGQQAVALSPDGALFAFARTDATVSVVFTPALP